MYHIGQIDWGPGPTVVYKINVLSFGKNPLLKFWSKCLNSDICFQEGAGQSVSDGAQRRTAANIKEGHNQVLL